MTHIPALSWCVDVFALLMFLAFHFISKALAKPESDDERQIYEAQRIQKAHPHKAQGHATQAKDGGEADGR